jgi:hypothetical protein
MDEYRQAGCGLAPSDYQAGGQVGGNVQAGMAQ